MPKIVAILTKEGGDWHETTPYMMTDPRQEIRTLRLVAVKAVDGTIWDINGIRNSAETEDDKKMRQIAADQNIHSEYVEIINEAIGRMITRTGKYSRRAATIEEQIRISLRAAERLFIEDSRRELSKLVNDQAEKITGTMRQIVEDGNNN